MERAEENRALVRLPNVREHRDHHFFIYCTCTYKWSLIYEINLMMLSSASFTSFSEQGIVWNNKIKISSY